jgi:hypothetical protein
MLHNKNFALDTAGSLASNYASPALDLTVYYGASLQAVWTGGSASGTLSLQFSNDGTNWSSDSASNTTVSGAGNFMWDIWSSQAAYVRISYAYASGTGSINIQVEGKTP